MDVDTDHEPKQFRCPICIDEIFMDFDKWQVHTRFHITINCKICPESFYNLNSYEIHFRTHCQDQASQTYCAQTGGIQEVKQTEPIKNETFDFIKVENGAFLLEDLCTTDIKEKIEYTFDVAVELINEKNDIFSNDRPPTNRKDNDKKNVDYKGHMVNTEQVSMKTMEKSHPIYCAICNAIINEENIFWKPNEVTEQFRKHQVCPCKICYRYFKTKAAYQKHKKFHLNHKNRNGWIGCDNCLEKNSCILSKSRPQNQKPNYSCSTCLQSFTTAQSFYTHNRAHLDRSVFTCTKCSMQIIGHYQFRYHNKKCHRVERSRIPVGQYECDICGKIFYNRSSIISHLKNHFVAKVKCPLCPTFITLKNNLKEHIARKHDKNYNLKQTANPCEVCGKIYYNKGYFKSHLRTHSDETPFSCSFCSKRFKFKLLLNRHLRIHTGEKPFQCNDCGKRYNDCSDLRRHKRSHGGIEKTFQCELCERKFYEPKQLRCHIISAHKMIL